MGSLSLGGSHVGRSCQQGFVGNAGLRRCTCGCLVWRSFAPAVRLSYIKGFQRTLNGGGGVGGRVYGEDELVSFTKENPLSS